MQMKLNKKSLQLEMKIMSNFNADEVLDYIWKAFNDFRHYGGYKLDVFCKFYPYILCASLYCKGLQSPLRETFGPSLY